MGLEEWYFGYLKNAFIPRYLLTLYRVHRVYHISFYSHFVQNKQSFITKKYSLYIVGEVRGGEAFDMMQCLNTGHDGSMSTGHANSCEDMLSRLENMILMGIEIPLAAIRQQIASGVDIIVHLGRLRDKTRRVLEIAEVRGYEKERITLQTLYQFVETGEDTAGRVEGILQKREELSYVEKLQAAGLR